MNIFNTSYILNNKYDDIRNSIIETSYNRIKNINNESIINSSNNINSNFSDYINSLYATLHTNNNSDKFISISNNSLCNTSNNNLNMQLLSINTQSLNSSLLNTNSNKYENISTIVNSLQSNNITQNTINNLLNNYINSDIYNSTDENISIDKIEQIVKKYCSQYNLDPDMIMAVIKTESYFDIDAVSKSGAVGLMQLMPVTAKEMGLKVFGSIDERLDVEKNIEAGIKYIAKYHKIISNHFGKEDWNLTLAAYNCGPNRVIKEGKIPNITETKNYVKKVNKYWNEYKSK